MVIMQFQNGKQISRDHIREFEAAHRKKMPPAYFEIVTFHDGASLFPNLCPVIDPIDGTPTVFGCDQLIPFVGNEAEVGYTMDSANSGSIDGLPKELIAFGIEAGGILFAFDYRKDPSTDDPPIVCYFGEYEDEFAIFPAASSFDTFINSLRSEDDIVPPSHP